MEYRDVKARCLFCKATVDGNQRDMGGYWGAPSDLIPEWKFNEEAGRRWLWYGAGDPVVHQDFYLCPEHNDPDYFYTAMKWADDHLRSREFIDFTDLQELPPPLTAVEKWKEPSLAEQVPDLGNIESREKLPNIWQFRDPRIGGCLDIANAINDIFEGCFTPLLLDYLELLDLPKPLELAEAIKKATRNIELLTEVENLADGEDLNQDS